jgi:hypothetical protein
MPTNIPQKSMGVVLTHIKRDGLGISNYETTIQSRRKRRVMIIQRRTLENGVSSTRSPSTTMLNVTQNSH